MKSHILKISLSLILGTSFVVASLGILTGLFFYPLSAHAAGARYVTPADLDTDNTCADSAYPCATV